MRYPKSLLRRNRELLSSQSIRSHNFMFARHKPGDEWKVGNDYPEFSKIKITPPQSFNWSAFSIPVWVRFTDNCEYKEGYGVVGYKVSTIRYSSRINGDFEDYTFDLIHKPIDYNYSHCELKVNKSLTKGQRREIRMTLKHNCLRSIYPNTNPSQWRCFLDKIRMISHRIRISIPGK